MYHRVDIGHTNLFLHAKRYCNILEGGSLNRPPFAGEIGENRHCGQISYRWLIDCNQQWRSTVQCCYGGRPCIAHTVTHRWFLFITWTTTPTTRDSGKCNYGRICRRIISKTMHAVGRKILVISHLHWTPSLPGCLNISVTCKTLPSSEKCPYDYLFRHNTRTWQSADTDGRFAFLRNHDSSLYYLAGIAIFWWKNANFYHLHSTLHFQGRRRNIAVSFGAEK